MKNVDLTIEKLDLSIKNLDLTFNNRDLTIKSRDSTINNRYVMIKARDFTNADLKSLFFLRQAVAPFTPAFFMFSCRNKDQDRCCFRGPGSR